MPAANQHPRAHLNTGGKPSEKPIRKAPEPDPEPEPIPSPEPARKRRKPPGEPTNPDRRVMVGTKLEPDEVAKLDRLRKRLGGEIETTRSAAIRWLVQQAEE